MVATTEKMNDFRFTKRGLLNIKNSAVGSNIFLEFDYSKLAFGQIDKAYIKGNKLFVEFDLSITTRVKMWTRYLVPSVCKDDGTLFKNNLISDCIVTCFGIVKKPQDKNITTISEIK